MRNPYEVLGLREGASIDEVKKAYRELVKKYHPDQYGDNPLKELAEEKLKEINEAYNMIMEGRTGTTQNNMHYEQRYSGNDSYGRSYSNSYSSGENDRFSMVIDAINRKDFYRAESILQSIRDRNARWYYLYGYVNYYLGRYGDAYSCFRMAVDMEPGNPEYREALNNMMSMRSNYQRNVYNTIGREDDCCRALCTLWACDTCCECIGGDMCSCF